MSLRAFLRVTTLIVIVVTPLVAVGPVPDAGQDVRQAEVTVEERRTVMESGPGRPPFDVTRHVIPLDRIRGGGPPIDGIPALGMEEPPRFVDADEADWLEDDDLLMGVRLGEDARAYPLQILNWHEAVNDVFATAGGEPPAAGGELPVAVVYCPLCGSGTVVSRRVETDAGERVLTFGISGKLYNSNVLLYDVRALSLWSQFGQGAVTGPLAGTPLEMLPSRTIGLPLEQQDVRHTTWKSWRDRYPDTRVLARDGQIYPGSERARDYERDPYGRMPRRVGSRVVGTYDYHEEGTPLLFEPESRPEDAPIDDKARVLGLYFGDGHYKAYPLEALEKAGGEVTDTVNGRTVTVRYENEHSGTVTDADGRPVRAVHAYWFAWYAFHPETALYWPDGD